ncbi:MAG: chorismate pyruvate-lyase family protein, partial [Candidatus Hydrothermarchaeaceae archaeon]
KQVPLSPLERILLTTDGSITRVLDALVGEEVGVVTEAQRVIQANKELASELDIEEGAEVNYRVVDLRSSKTILVHAISYSPLERLAKEFKEDIMKKDMPIGRIMSSLNMESRREIKGFEAVRGDEELCRRFRLSADSLFLKRQYHIIHGGEVFLSITEIFPKGVY